MQDSKAPLYEAFRSIEVISEREWFRSCHYPDGSFEQFALDGAGERIQHEDSEGITSYLYDLGDRLLSTTGVKSANYDYDLNGNLVQKTSADGVTDYSYSARDRLTGVTLPDGRTNSFSYYPLSDLRFSKTDANLVEQRFLHDGSGVIEELSSENETTRSFIDGPGIDEHLGMVIHDALNGDSYMHM